MYDNQLRNPVGSSSSGWQSIHNYDYDKMMKWAEDEPDLSHLVPQVCHLHNLACIIALHVVVMAFFSLFPLLSRPLLPSSPPYVACSV